MDELLSTISIMYDCCPESQCIASCFKTNGYDGWTVEVLTRHFACLCFCFSSSLSNGRNTMILGELHSERTCAIARQPSCKHGLADDFMLYNVQVLMHPKTSQHAADSATSMIITTSKIIKSFCHETIVLHI